MALVKWWVIIQNSNGHRKTYSQIEKEALALTLAATKLSMFTFETDHKCLLELLQTKNLDYVTPRIQRFRMHLLRFSYIIVVYVPGKQLTIADALSRSLRQYDSDDDYEL